MTTASTGATKSATTKEKPKPYLLPQFCKGCGRCIDACAKHCITPGDEINPQTGLLPVIMNLDACNGCGLCMDACPEPYGLRVRTSQEFELSMIEPEAPVRPAKPVAIPDEEIDVPAVEPLVIKGTYASAIGALLAGCRHVFGYPITPSTEGAELMAKLLPGLDGVFFQAVSEVATVNMMYGASGAGKPCMTFTSSPGLSLMLEGISYMIGAELPGVFVDIMRGGPGLGNIAPEQSDIKLAVHGLGHGNTHALVLAPSTPQEMLDLTKLAFELSMKYRNPVFVLGDGYLGQMTGKVVLPSKMTKPGVPDWAVTGDREHRGNLICSFHLSERELEEHNFHLNRKYAAMAENEQRASLFECEDAEVVVVATNTPARMAKGAVQDLRQLGVKAGLFRPITIWPFPMKQLQPLLGTVKEFLVVEASEGQLENELRLAMSHAGVTPPKISSLRHMGGVLPQQPEIVSEVLKRREIVR